MEKIIFCEECGKDKVHYLEENDFRHTEQSHWVCSHHSECERCEGKGYYNLSATYDDIHSRIECDYCMGDGYEEAKG
ncbi:hypothetical protein P105_gp08 [Pelagibacter phage HTVC105P]|nr:hypothetical protein P105_gp08 [Pelagibacter phage HTVC105P]